MASNQLRDLPEPEGRPGADVVLFDGACPLCQASAHWLARLDGGRRLTFLPFQDPRVARSFPDLSPEAIQKHLHVVDHRGRRHKGAAAVRYLTRRLPALWLAAPLLHLPGSMPFWKWLYTQIARRRRRRECGTGNPPSFSEMPPCARGKDREAT
ncbi:MAG: DUF393 domain-containing protein [Pirellulales bacterium]|nr:DUF393 domain-containing protein [Pirellulales bacterium]